MNVRRLSLRTGEVHELKGHSALVKRTRFSPDGSSMLSFSQDGTVRVWDTKNTEPLRTLKRHDGDVRDAEYLGNDRIVSSGDDADCWFWSIHTDRTVELLRNSVGLRTLDVLASNGHIVVHDADNRVLDVAPDSSVRIIEQGRDAITMLRASTDGRFVAIGRGAGSVSVYDTREYRIFTTAFLHRPSIR